MEEQQQQQQVKPLTSVSEQSAVAAAATYVDSPRKVGVAPQQVTMSHLICCQFPVGGAAALVLGSSWLSLFLLLLFVFPL